LAEVELTTSRPDHPLKAEASKRTQRNASEDLAYFEGVGRGARERGVTYTSKVRNIRLDGAKEELAQLKKMYAQMTHRGNGGDHIEAPEICGGVAEYFLETAKQSGELTLKTGLPREYETPSRRQTRPGSGRGLRRTDAGTAVGQKASGGGELKRDQRKAEKRLAELKKEPGGNDGDFTRDGLLYYGAVCRGRAYATTGAAVGQALGFPVERLCVPARSS
jgi:hypothetical protein